MEKIAKKLTGTERHEAMSKKYIGYGIVEETRGIKRIIIVPAKTKPEAIEQLEALDMPVESAKHIRRVCVVKYPGPSDVKSMETADWNKCFEIEDKDNG